MKKAATAAPDVGSTGWENPVAGRDYERRVSLSKEDKAAISSWLQKRVPGNQSHMTYRSEERESLLWLFKPLEDVLDHWQSPSGVRSAVIMLFIRECVKNNRTFWSWNDDQWAEFFGRTNREFFDRHKRSIVRSIRIDLAAIAYLHGWFKDYHALGTTQRKPLANRVFDPALVSDAVQKVAEPITQWGYALGRPEIVRIVCDILLRNGSPYLADITFDKLVIFRELQQTRAGRRHYYTVSRALVHLGIVERALERGPHIVNRPDLSTGVAREWCEWVDRWAETSTKETKDKHRTILLKVGRWLAEAHPETVSPQQWTRKTAASFVAMSVGLRVGDYTAGACNHSRKGLPLYPGSVVHIIDTVRSFFCDFQEWEWIPRRFDPVRSIVAPQSLRGQIGPKPRVISDDVWARLLWAGLNLKDEDNPRSGRHPGNDAKIFHLEYIRAVAMVWLFAALRDNEVRRLRVGCVRWQPADIEGQKPVCLLDVPENKTGAPYSKPVDPAVGEAIEAWMAVRPDQPRWQDPKTGELIDPLFMYRALPMSDLFLNNTLIPLLCRKAGVPEHDVRGRITSHRARATIANQLFNSREPMTLSELQTWLGHRSPHSTQHYVSITPLKLARAYRDAGYFERNTRVVKVLLDRDRFMSSPDDGQAWLHYDLGHGWCNYEFFDRCPHRMACAKCDFYIPKESTVAQLLEASENNHRFLKSIPVTDEEQAAADGDTAAIKRLVSRLEHQPTPSGQTPSELRQQASQNSK